MHQVLLATTAFAYLLAFYLLYSSMRHATANSRSSAVLAAAAGVGLHAWSQVPMWFGLAGASVSILDVLSLCSLVVIVLILASRFTGRSLFDAGFVALPLACVVVLAQWLISAPASLVTQSSSGVTAHIVSSVLAFGIFSVAGIYALFSAMIDYCLRHHHLNRLVKLLPALEVLEQVMFQLIGLGMLFLTVSLGTGWIYVNDLLAQHLVHKTVLSVLAWLLFGTLLWGRHFRGWRGRLAVRLTLAGTALLLLSYFGSKLVLEVVLERGWQT